MCLNPIQKERLPPPHLKAAKTQHIPARHRTHARRWTSRRARTCLLFGVWRAAKRVSVLFPIIAAESLLQTSVAKSARPHPTAQRSAPRAGQMEVVRAGLRLCCHRPIRAIHTAHYVFYCAQYCTLCTVNCTVHRGSPLLFVWCTSLIHVVYSTALTRLTTAWAAAQCLPETDDARACQAGLTVLYMPLLLLVLTPLHSEAHACRERGASLGGARKDAAARPESTGRELGDPSAPFRWRERERGSRKALFVLADRPCMHAGDEGQAQGLRQPAIPQMPCARPMRLGRTVLAQ